MPIGLNVDEYKAHFSGGARAYLFYVDLKIPGVKDNNIPYYVRSTNTPESSFEEIVIPYPGHYIKMAGTRNYGAWSVSFNVDRKTNLLEYLNKWHNLIYDPYSQAYSSPNSYMIDESFYLLDELGAKKREYKLISAWPLSIGTSSFDYSSTEIVTIDVTFSYQYYMTNITKISKIPNMIVV